MIRKNLTVFFISESWCELHVKSGCSSASSIRSHLHQSVNPEMLEKLLHEAQRETNYPSTSISVQSSPKTPQTPITNQDIYNNNELEIETTFNRIDLLLNDQSMSKYPLINSHNSSNKLSNSTLKNEELTSLNLSQNLNSINNSNNTDPTINSNKEVDWVLYWSSRPQMQPPKYAICFAF